MWSHWQPSRGRRPAGHSAHKEVGVCFQLLMLHCHFSTFPTCLWPCLRSLHFTARLSCVSLAMPFPWGSVSARGTRNRNPVWIVWTVRGLLEWWLQNRAGLAGWGISPPGRDFTFVPDVNVHTVKRGVGETEASTIVLPQPWGLGGQKARILWSFWCWTKCKTKHRCPERWHNGYSTEHLSLGCWVLFLAKSVPEWCFISNKN